LGDINLCRGRHPLPVAILKGHKSMGATVHLINSEKIDAGPVLAKVLFPIDYRKSYRYNENKLIEVMRLMTGLLLEDYLKKGGFSSYAWDSKNSVYYKPLNSQILNTIVNSDNLEGFSNESSN